MILLIIVPILVWTWYVALSIITSIIIYLYYEDRLYLILENLDREKRIAMVISTAYDLMLEIPYNNIGDINILANIIEEEELKLRKIQTKLGG